MAPVERTYFSVQPPYENLERVALLKILEIRGFAVEDVVDLARRELIDLCVDNDVEAQIVAEDDPQDYPVRRPLSQELPSWFRDGTGPVRIRWVDDWLGGEWGRGQRAPDVLAPERDGSEPPGVVIEVARARVPVVLAVSRPRPARRRSARSTGRASTPSDHGPFTVLLPQIVLWDDVLTNLGGVQEPAGDIWVDDASSALRSSVVELARAPRAVFVSCGPCPPRHLGDELVALAGVLQRTYESASRAGRCDVCARSLASRGLPEVHLDRPSERALQLELQDHVDDAALVCADCHVLLHGPSVSTLRQALRPVCPACRDRGSVRPVAGGMLPPSEVADDAVVFGCAVGPGLMPQWSCVACEVAFAVIRTDEELTRTPRRISQRAAMERLAAEQAVARDETGHPGPSGR